MFSVKSKHGFGLFDGERWHVAPRFAWIGFFHGGYAFAKLESGVECLITMGGEQFELAAIAEGFCEPGPIEFIAPNEAINTPGSLLVASESGWTIAVLDKQLKPSQLITIPNGPELAGYYGGSSLFVRHSGTATPQMLVIRPERCVTFDGFDYIDPPIEDIELLAAKRSDDSGRWAYCNPRQGKTLDGSYYLAQSFSNGLGMIQRELDSRFEFVDTRFETVPELVFDWADVFRFGLAAAEKNGVLGYYDNLGRCQIDLDGDLGRFNRLGHAIVTYETEPLQTKIIDRKGNVLIDKLESCTFFDGDFPCYHAVLTGSEVILTQSLEVIPQVMS